MSCSLKHSVATYVTKVHKIVNKVISVPNYVINPYGMKLYGGVGVYIHVFLTSALVGGEWSASRPDPFTPG
jgi:Na+-translocating ferredoxin:NAD+ oxidoreductase RnfE subunit